MMRSTFLNYVLKDLEQERKAHAELKKAHAELQAKLEEEQLQHKKAACQAEMLQELAGYGDGCLIEALLLLNDKEDVSGSRAARR